METLLKSGAYANTPNKHGDTVLMLAAQAGHSECIRMLLDAGAHMNKCNEHGMAALIVAACDGHSQCVEILLQAGANVNKCNNYSYTALMFAANKGHNHCMEILLRAGADLKKCDNDDHTALFFAAAEGQIESVEILLKAGAYVNKAGKNGETALSIAAAIGHSTCVGYLLKAGGKYKSNALIDAANNGHYESVDLLIEAGADVHVVINGRTVLHFCKERSNIRVVQRLLRAGADVNRLNKGGCNALTELIKCGNSKHLNMAFVLLAAGETFVKTSGSGNNTLLPVLEEMMLKEIKPGLSHLCREAIRSRLLKLDPHKNLFHRIPRLEGILPIQLIEYLLYDMSLETIYDDDENKNLEKENN